ncbi:hypothetical protein [Flavobacterium sp.]|uniref:hypothetical protein n=1 Tax=Flavobacterium sp. TaxID=239 RepID=UPI0025EDE3F3|nr:hypothetical protein [Flavobacterium sp.]
MEPSKHDINQNPIKMVITPKNKFLYPSDEFGMMEKGLVVDSKTYGDQLPEPTGDKTFEIIDKP